MHGDDLISVRVTHIDTLDRDIRFFHLVSNTQEPLPAFEPGAHVDVHFPNDIIRSYSLCGDGQCTEEYGLAVKLDEETRGGSLYLHTHVYEGSILRISPPRSHFRIDEQASEHVFIAGGIGITPFFSMMHELDRRGAAWRLYFSVRPAESLPFSDDLARWGDRVSVIDTTKAGRMDFGAILDRHGKAATYYCCGPNDFIASLEEVAEAKGFPPVLSEKFKADLSTWSVGLETFTVRLVRSGVEVTVGPGERIIDALEQEGVFIPYACREGTCGACEMRVISGRPVHNDVILSEAQRREGDVVMICCAGSETEVLEIDY